MLYFDTSFLAPFILEEAASAKIEAFFAKLPVGELYVDAVEKPLSSRIIGIKKTARNSPRCF